MSSIIISVLSSTVGLLSNKVRDMTGETLKDGEVTSAKIRKMVVRELKNVKNKDLVNSCQFLEDGVDLLNFALYKAEPKDEKKASLNEDQNGRGETSKMPSSVESGFLNEALEPTHTMGKLKIKPDEEFESAKKRFQEAYKIATDVFCNESFSITERIFAAKLRVVGEILESCLEQPETPITGFLSFLRDLHSLPAISAMFSLYLNGGMKSRLNKAERARNVKSIVMINFILYQFAFKLSNKYCSLLVWPTIKVADGSFNPILDWRKVFPRIPTGGLQPPNMLDFGFVLDPSLSAVNSHGEIVVAGIDDIEIVSRIKKTEEVKLPDSRENESDGIAALSVDENNNVYILRLLRKYTEKRDVFESYVLYVFDENYKVKRGCTFDFEAIGGDTEIRIAVNKNNDIIMIKFNDLNVYVFDNTGKLKQKFKRETGWGMGLCVSENNNILVTSDGGQAIDIYTEDGNLKSTVKVPEGHAIHDLAYSCVISKIIVLAFVLEENSYFLFVCSETGELESLMLFSDCKIPPSVRSHPSGPVAVIKRRTIIYI